MKMQIKQATRKDHSLWWLIFAILAIGCFYAGYAYPAAQDLGDVAKHVTGTLDDLAKMITAGSYVAGFGFAIGAILKFKAHKDNPTQIPVGTPIALIFIAAALIFLPSIFGVTGKTLFGSGSEVGTVSGVTSFDH